MTKKRGKNIVTLETQCEEFATLLAEEVYFRLEDELDKIGPDNYRHLAATFIAGLTSALVYRSLTKIPGNLKTKQAKFDWAQDSFLDMKTRIQEAVASGFTGGMKAWSGKDLDYYCTIKVTPEPKNTEPC